MDQKALAMMLDRILYGRVRPDDVRVQKYKGTRYWAVWIQGNLLAVTVYKKGAMAIKEKLVQSSLADRTPETASRHPPFKGS